MSELVTNKITIEVSEDGYEAWATAGDLPVQPDELREALEGSGIVFGLIHDAFPVTAANGGTRALVAKGTAHEDGTDGRFELLKLHEQRPSESKLGIMNVYAGEVFGIIHAQTSGTAGTDIRGRKVEPKPGRQLSMFTGPNINRREEGDKTFLEALADGNLKIGPASVEILPEHVIHGDIDYSDGEIHFAGSLRVTGDIKGSGSLRVRHDLTVLGSVEDAKIVADGNVVVKGSFVGRGDGHIRAGGNVEVHVVLNQSIDCGGSITITKECVNAHLIAADSIYAGTAVIMGGVITAGNKIEVRTLGGELYSTTRVRVGASELLTDEMGVINKEIESQTRSCDEMKKRIYDLVRDRLDARDFTEEKSAELKRLQVRLQEANEALKSLGLKKQETSAAINRSRSPRLKVGGTAHQSVVMEINGVRHALKHSYSNLTFEESRREIVQTKNM